MGNTGMKQPKVTIIPIGIMEVSMMIARHTKEGKIEDSQKFNLHVLFSVYEQHLNAYCLDLSVRSRVEIMDAIRKDPSLSDRQIAERLLADVRVAQFCDVMDHLQATRRMGSKYFEIHAQEKYWKMFRKIRQDRDNYYYTKLYYPGSDLHEFITVEDQLADHIRDIKSSDDGGLLIPSIDTEATAFNQKFVAIIGQMRSAA